MAYIQSEEHLINYFRKKLREAGYYLEPEQIILLSDFYQWSKNYTHGRAVDILTWELKDKPERLNKEFVENIKNNIDVFISKDVLDDYSVEFLKETEKRFGNPGVYFIYNKSKQLIYVGKSKNLATRIFQSIKERSSGKPYYVRFIDCKTYPDASILEMYFIGKLKPSFNKDGATIEEITLKVGNIPKMSKFIKIFSEKLENKQKNE